MAKRRNVSRVELDAAIRVIYFCQYRNKQTAMKLTPVIERYVLHWGEMGSRWGVNRSVAQVHALLYLAGRPMTAEEIDRKSTRLNSSHT